MTTYSNDDEAREDWDAEREAFLYGEPAGEDALPLPFDEPLVERFWIDSKGGLPVVKDRLYDDRVCAQFITLAAATAYKDLRDVGVGHSLAWCANPESCDDDEIAS